MFCKSLKLALCISLIGAGASYASADKIEAISDSDAQKMCTEATNWTPVLIQACFAPRPFAGSENEWHLTYDLQLQNISKHPATIKRIEVLGRKGNGEWKAIKIIEGAELQSHMHTILKENKKNVLPGAQNAFAFVNLNFADRADIPDTLKHRLMLNTIDLMGVPSLYDYKGAQIKVESEAPVRISPPLRGGKWVACGGYAGLTGHRTANFPVDNGMHAAQTFAIDWVRIDEKGYSVSDTKTCEGNACYDQPIYAVADGVVIGCNTRFPNQVPYKPTGRDRMLWAGGNSVVIKMDNGYYAFYAHMKPGSTKVKAGDRVVRGQQIGNVGNSGNSTGPHLHMHVTRDPGILQADGVPYVFDEFEVVGEVDMDNFFENDSKAKVQTVSESKYKGEHRDQLPHEGHVVIFK